MGKPQRDKGRRGQREAIKLLEEYGYIVQELNSGKKSGDLIVSFDKYLTDDPEFFLVEVKNQKSINISAFLKQARENAKEKKMKWMLMCKIDGGFGWLVLCQGEKEADIWFL